MTIKCRALRRRYELDGAEKTMAHLSQAPMQKQLPAEDFSLRDLTECPVPGRRH